MTYQPERHYCPNCGKPDVVVGLNCVLLEVRPNVRPHACR